MNEYDTMEIIFWDYLDKYNTNFNKIGYWELDGCYQYRMCGNAFMKVDSIVLNKIIREGQKILDCYLGELERIEMM